MRSRTLVVPIRRGRRWVSRCSFSTACVAGSDPEEVGDVLLFQDPRPSPYAQAPLPFPKLRLYARVTQNVTSIGHPSPYDPPPPPQPTSDKIDSRTSITQGPLVSQRAGTSYRYPTHRPPCPTSFRTSGGVMTPFTFYRWFVDLREGVRLCPRRNPFMVKIKRIYRDRAAYSERLSPAYPTPTNYRYSV